MLRIVSHQHIRENKDRFSIKIGDYVTPCTIGLPVSSGKVIGVSQSHVMLRGSRPGHESWVEHIPKGWVRKMTDEEKLMFLY